VIKYKLLIIFLSVSLFSFGQIEDEKIKLPLTHHTQMFWCEYDGDKILSYGKDGRVILRELSSGKIINHFDNVEGDVNTAHFSPNGKFIITTLEWGNSIQIWDVQNARLIRVVECISGENQVQDAFMSPNINSLLINCGNSFVVYDLNEELISMNIKVDSDGYINTIKYNSSGEFILVGTNSKTCYVYSVNERKLVKEKKHSDEITSIYLDSKKEKVLSVDFSGDIFIWEIKTGKTVKSFTNRPEKNFFSTNSSNSLFVFNNSENQFEVWSLDDITKRLSTKVGADSLSISDLTFDYKNRVLSLSADKNDIMERTQNLIVHDSSNGFPLKTFDLKSVWTLYPHPDNSYLLVKTVDAIELLDLETSEMIYELKHQFLYSTSLFVNNWKLLVSLNQGSCMEMDLSEGTLNSEFKKNSQKLFDSKFSPSCSEVYCINENQIMVWNRSNKSLNHIFGDGLNGFTSFAFSNDGEYFVTSSDDKSIKIWDIKNGDLIKTSINHDHMVTSVCFNKAGNQILSSSADKSAVLYDFKSDKISHTFRHDDFVTRAIFSTGEDTVISCARNVFLWNKKTGDLIKKLTSCGETFKNTICLSHSGNILAVAGLDKIYLVDVFHDSLIGTLNYLYPVENITFSENDLFLISSSEENSITFWDVHEMKELLTTYFFENQEMELIHISPEGLFDCKPELFNKLVYPNHLEVDPNLLINNKFYTPGLWKKMIKY